MALKEIVDGMGRVSYGPSDVPTAGDPAPGREVLVAGEVDPHGVDQHSPGAKLDSGKPRGDLVLGSFCRALASVVDVGTFGANKYTDNGWLSVPDGIKRYSDARMRHYLKRKAGENFDEDSRLMHLAHEAWNVLAELELTLREIENEE